jgi:glycosyltransferase involved in cell wall biosynthesis
MRKLRILHVYNDFDEFNGLIGRLIILSKTTNYRAFDLAVCVFSYEPNEHAKQFESFGGQLFSLNEPYGSQNILRAFVKLYRFIKRYEPDIIQTYSIKSNIMGIFAAALAGVPVICGSELTLTDVRQAGPLRWRRQILRPVLNKLIKRCDSFIFNSYATKVAWFGDVQDPKFRILYPPFDLANYDQAMKVAVERDTAHRPTIGFVGRLSEQKGVTVLLKAMPLIKNRVPDARLVFVGTGPEEDALKALSKELGVESEVQFVGFKPNVFEYIRQMDILALPSRTEGFGRVALEAMAMGIPVIASSVGGLKELVVEGETGLFVPYGSVEKLAAAAVELLSERERRLEMGRKGHDRAFGKFHPLQYTRACEDLYLRLYMDKIKERSINADASERLTF